MKVRYNGPSDELYFVDGQIYEVVASLHNHQHYGVIDEVGDVSLVETDGFTIVEGSIEDVDWYESRPVPGKDYCEDYLVHKGKKNN